MNLSAHVYKDLENACTLYERKLASMGILALHLRRAVDALRQVDPAGLPPIADLADAAESLDAEGVAWIEGMNFVDRVRAALSAPPALHIVPDPVQLADEVPDAPEEAAADETGSPPRAIPDDAAEPATPNNLLPIRDL